MFLHLIFPIVLYFTLANQANPEPGTLGVHTTTENRERQTEETLEEASPTPVVTQVQTESSSTVASGDSQVSIKIDNNTVEIHSGGNGGGVDLASFQYPGSQTVETSTTMLVLYSNDSPSAITDWYQGQIESRGMNTKSFVKTNSNGSILNKLAGAGNGAVAIEISAQEGSSPTKIIVKSE